MNVIIIIFTLFFGKQVGKDHWGNRYYQSKGFLAFKAKRWVLFVGSKEPSKVPPHWDMWLKKIIDKPINNPNKLFWQKERLPNFTGTDLAHNPTKYNKTIKSYNNYQPWNRD